MAVQERVASRKRTRVGSFFLCGSERVFVWKPIPCKKSLRVRRHDQLQGPQIGDDVIRFVHRLPIDEEAGNLAFAADFNEFSSRNLILIDVFELDGNIDVFHRVEYLYAKRAVGAVVEFEHDASPFKRMSLHEEGADDRGPRHPRDGYRVPVFGIMLASEALRA